MMPTIRAGSDLLVSMTKQRVNKSLQKELDINSTLSAQTCQRLLLIWAIKMLVFADSEKIAVSWQNKSQQARTTVRKYKFFHPPLKTCF